MLCAIYIYNTNYLLLLCHQGHKLGKTQISDEWTESKKGKLSKLVIIDNNMILNLSSYDPLSPCLSTWVLEYIQLAY